MEKHFNNPQVENTNIQRLLEGFKNVKSSQAENAIVRVQRLLEGFKEVERSFHKVQERSMDWTRLLLDGFVEARDRRIIEQKTKAEDINIFEILDFSDDEIRHSKFLAWLLNPNV
jgi:hypothetical protein